MEAISRAAAVLASLIAGSDVTSMQGPRRTQSSDGRPEPRRTLASQRRLRYLEPPEGDERAMELQRRALTSELLDPRRGFELVQAQVEVRWDPLTRHSARLVVSGALMPPNDFDLEAFAREAQITCPFCADRLEAQTPRLPARICEQGRIRRGDAVLFPNLLTYAKHSSVSVYSPALHYLPLERMTPRLVADNLAAQVAFDRAVLAADPDAQWVSINANHMLPSGSSLFDPHPQGSVDPVPTAQCDAYLATERAAGERYLGSSGRVEWLASFAPLAPCELRAFIPEVVS